VASEFLPLDQVIEVVQNAVLSAGARLDRRPGGTPLVLGECSAALSLELRTDGPKALARFPSIEERVPPEYVSQIRLTFRAGLRLEDG
jgi:hypothetical protein